MSYLGHFNLDREPFSNAPDARFYFDSDQHSQALVRLMYAVNSNKGLAVLVGGWHRQDDFGAPYARYIG